jgi:hypothetical protein
MKSLLYLLVLSANLFSDQVFEFSLSNSIEHELISENKNFSLYCVFQRSRHFENPYSAVGQALGKGVDRSDNWPLKLKIVYNESNKFQLIKLSEVPHQNHFKNIKIELNVPKYRFCKILWAEPNLLIFTNNNGGNRGISHTVYQYNEKWFGILR